MRKEKQMTYLYIGPVQLLPIHLPFSSRGVQYIHCAVYRDWCTMQINTGKEHHLFSHSQYIFILPSCPGPVHHQHCICHNAANSKVRCKTRRDTVGSGFFFLFPGFLLFSTNTNLPTFSCYHLPPEAVYIQTY